MKSEKWLHVVFPGLFDDKVKSAEGVHQTPPADLFISIVL